MRLFAIASMCLTVQSTRSPGDGCCVDTMNGFSLTQSYPLHYDSLFDSIPEGAQCEDEISGTEAIQREGNAYQSFSANCLMDDGITTYRSVDWNFANGSSGSGTIIYYANGTVEAACSMSTQLKNSMKDGSCIGPKYDDNMVFVGNVTYGSLTAERYAMKPGWTKNVFVDVDVDNGCIPITSAMVSGTTIVPLTITNYNNSDPPESLFVIPQECFQHGSKATAPVTHPRGFLGSLKPMRTSSVV